jgi:hypothetical protein
MNNPKDLAFLLALLAGFASFLGAQDVSWKTHTDQGNHFSVDYPADWEVLYPAKYFDGVMFGKGEASFDVFTPMCELEECRLSLPLQRNLKRGYLQQNIVVNGMPAVALYGTHWYSNQPTVEIHISSHTYPYVITYQTSRMKRATHQPFFDAMLKSFKSIPAPADRPR